MKNLKKAINKIEEDGIEEIIELAVKNLCQGFDTVVHYDPQEYDYSVKIWSSNTYLNPESRLVEVYRVDGNFIGNSNLEVGDIIDEDEYKELCIAVAKDKNLTDKEDIRYTVNFLDDNQLGLINIDLTERLEIYFSWCQENLHPDDQILGTLKRKKAEYESYL